MGSVMFNTPTAIKVGYMLSGWAISIRAIDKFVEKVDIWLSWLGTYWILGGPYIRLAIARAITFFNKGITKQITPFELEAYT